MLCTKAEAAIQVNGGDVEALMTAGQALLDLKRPEEALEMFNDALEIQPDNQEVLTDMSPLVDRIFDRRLRVLNSSTLHSRKSCG